MKALSRFYWDNLEISQNFTPGRLGQQGVKHGTRGDSRVQKLGQNTVKIEV